MAASVTRVAPLNTLLTLALNVGVRVEAKVAEAKVAKAKVAEAVVEVISQDSLLNKRPRV